MILISSILLIILSASLILLISDLINLIIDPRLLPCAAKRYILDTLKYQCIEENVASIYSEILFYEYKYKGLKTKRKIDKRIEELENKSNDI